MATNFSDTLVIGISSTALFDLAEADAEFCRHKETDPNTAVKKWYCQVNQRRQN